MQNRKFRLVVGQSCKSYLFIFNLSNQWKTANRKSSVGEYANVDRCQNDFVVFGFVEVHLAGNVITKWKILSFFFVENNAIHQLN